MMNGSNKQFHTSTSTEIQFEEVSSHAESFRP